MIAIYNGAGSYTITLESGIEVEMTDKDINDIAEISNDIKSGREKVDSLLVKEESEEHY